MMVSSLFYWNFNFRSILVPTDISGGSSVTGNVTETPTKVADVAAPLDAKQPDIPVAAAAEEPKSNGDTKSEAVSALNYVKSTDFI